MPLRTNGNLAFRAEPDDTAIDAERRPGLADGDAHELVDVELASHTRGDPRHEALAIERLGKRSSGSRAIEREPSLRGERLHQPELLRREHAVLARRAHDENGDHLLVRDERDVGEALRAHRLYQTAADDLRSRRVVDGEGSRLEHRGRDARGLALEIDSDLREPVELLTAEPADETGACFAVLRDEDQRRDLDAHELLDFGEHGAGNRDRVIGSTERRRDRHDGIELTPVRRRR
jgi:hypothetical protein